VLVVVELSDIAFAMDSVPAAFGITTDGYLVWCSSMCAILCLRSLYTLVVRFIAELEYMNKAIGLVLFFIAGKLLAKILFHSELSTSLSLGVVGFLLAGGAGVSVYTAGRKQREEEGEGGSKPPLDA